MSNYKSFDTYLIESPIVEVGNFTDMDRKEFTVTPDMVRHIYDIIQSRKSPAKIIDIHDGTEIGEVRKYELSSDGTKIIQKGLILDSERFSRRQNQGYKFVSPEIVINRDINDRIISVDIDKLALTQNPGMIPSMFTTEKFRFSAPHEDEQHMENEKPESNSWKEPIGELEKRIQNMSSKLDQIGDKIMTEEKPAEIPASNTITLTQEQLTDLVKNAVSEQLKNVQQPPKVEEAPKQSEDDDTKVTLPQEMVDKLNRMEAELEKYRSTTNATLQTRFDTISKDLKDMGVENPEELVSDSTLTLEQKISVLEGHKKSRIKNSGITSPLREPLSGDTSGSNQKKKITVSDVLKKLNAENSPDLREKIAKLKIFDENGVFIG